jgi:hypothetical protein
MRRQQEEHKRPVMKKFTGLNRTVGGIDVKNKENERPPQNFKYTRLMVDSSFKDSKGAQQA